MTPKLIGNMVGIRATTSRRAPRCWKKTGLIAYRNGTIVVLDRPGVEDRSCECYGVVKKEYDRLLPEAAVV